MSDTRINTIKIKDLPESSTLSDSDIVLKDNGIITHKFKLSTLIQYIKNHTEISKFFVHQSTVNSASGIAPLDVDKKVPTANIRYGKTTGTVYQGSEGAALETTINTHILDTNNPHSTTKSQVGLSNANNTSDINKPVSTAQRNAIDSAYENSNLYTDTKINALVNGAPETLNTLKEVANAISENKTVVDALNTAIGTKANKTELDTHTGNATIHITATDRTNWNDSNAKKHTHGNKSVLDGITSALITNWNSAFTHISDSVKHITSAERILWTTVSNKVDSVSGKGLSANDFTNILKSNYDTAYANKHTHSNKTTIDKLSETSGILMFDGKQIQGGGTDEYVHPKPTQTNTTSSSSIGYGGTFSVLDVITSNVEGHITGVNTKTITLPAAPTSVSGSSGSCSGTAAYANLINGVYTGNGGRQPPSYIPNGKIRWNMMNTTINNDANYKDFMLMDTYGGADVPYVTGLGITKHSGNPKAFLIVGKKNGSDWVGNEIITTTNTATKATNDAYGNEIINQKTSAAEPTNQKVGDYWVKEY